MELCKIFFLCAFFAIASCDNNDRPTATDDQDAETTSASTPNETQADTREPLSRPPTPIEVAVPAVNARRGRILFTTNGCVICHQINSVGGSVAPSLDAYGDIETINPLDFSARMWRGARAMTELQSAELGYIIDLDGQDIADLAAFVASEDEQALFTLNSVPAEMQDWFLNTRLWDTENWDEYRDRGERIPFDDDQ